MLAVNKLYIQYHLDLICLEVVVGESISRSICCLLEMYLQAHAMSYFKNKFNILKLNLISHRLKTDDFHKNVKIFAIKKRPFIFHQVSFAG